ncbi:MAG: hypothetical protein EXR78_08560 [Deltaproteobacteria bacterium]|nr:hypothetical protein [Deltaproteobacteria bacterium]
MTIVVSYGKSGKEGQLWAEEVVRASNSNVRFVPFNHRQALGGVSYDSSDRLDQDYRSRHLRLDILYQQLDSVLTQTGAQCLFVTNDNVYHPDHLLKLPLYRALYTTDDPGSTYTRTIPYLHAFDHVFHCSPSYSATKTLKQKLLECGARRVDFLPLGVFDFEMEASRGESEVFSQKRDIDLIYVGSPFFHKKFNAFLTLTRAFGHKLKLYGFWRAKHCLYLSLHARRLHWVRPVSLEERVRLYQRAKIGFNLHWDSHGLGNQRLYHLPANGVMQICDAPQCLSEIFRPGREIIPAHSTKEMVEKARYYLSHDHDRESIALGGYRRTVQEYRIAQLLRRAASQIRGGLEAWSTHAPSR